MRFLVSFMVLFMLLTFSALADGGAPGADTAKQSDSTASKVKSEPKLEMHTYYMVFLRRGPNWTAEQTEETKRLGEGHMAHLIAHADSGYIVIAGPFLEQGTTPGVLAGIAIYRVDSKEIALRIAERDPAVQAGRFTIEVLPWMGPKTLHY